MVVSRCLVLLNVLLIVGLVLSNLSCGGSSVTDTVSDSDAMDDEMENGDDSVVEVVSTEDDEQASELDVTITVTKTTVKPGEQIELTASVQGVNASDIVLNWLNITEYGTLSTTNDYSVTWTAPTTLGEENTEVEVLQLVVTAISEVVSVGSSGIKTDTQILTETNEVLLKIVQE